MLMKLSEGRREKQGRRSNISSIVFSIVSFFFFFGYKYALLNVLNAIKAMPCNL